MTAPNDNDKINLRIDLAAAHREAVKNGLSEGIDNHFTAMVPGYTDRFYVNSFGLHWSEVSASNLLEVDFDGRTVSGDGEANLTAVSIHVPMHRRGIECVLHTHMPYTTALTQLEDMSILPSSQNGLILHDQIAYDYNYNGIADAQEEGERMAETLGHKKILLLANHGAVTTGATVAEAYHRLYFLERAAMTQMLAMASGKQRLISDDAINSVQEFLATFPELVQLEVKLYFNAVKRVLKAEGSNYME